MMMADKNDINKPWLEVQDSKYEEVEIPVMVHVINELQIPFVTAEEIIKTESGITVIVKIKKENKKEINGNGTN